MIMPRGVRVRGSLLALLLAFFAFTADAWAEPRLLRGTVQIDPELDNAQAIGDHALAMAGQGEAAAIWGTYTSSLEGALRAPGAAFTEPAVVGPGMSAALPKLAMAPSGHTIAVWRATVMGTDQVMAAIRQPGAASFGTPFQVSSELHHNPNLAPDVGVGDSGRALVVWQSLTIGGDIGSQRIRQRVVEPDGGFLGSAAYVSGNGMENPTVAVGPGGDAVVGWEQFSTGDPNVLYEGADGAIFDSESFPDAAGNSPHPAVDADGNAVVVYNDGSALVARSRPAGLGQNFGPPETVNAPGTSPASQPAIEMDGSGRATVSYIAHVPGAHSVQAAVRPAGPAAQFGDPEGVSGLEAAVPGSLSLGVGQDGSALVGWTDGDTDRVALAYRPAGAGEFDPPHEDLSPAGQVVGMTRAAVDGEGAGLVSYSNRGPMDTRYRIDARVLADSPRPRDLAIPGTATAGTAVQLSVQAESPWFPLASIQWDFGDGTTGSGPDPTHAYAEAGAYTVTVEVRDSEGNTGTASGSIQVKPAGGPAGEAPRVTGFKLVPKRLRAAKAGKGKKRKPASFRFTLSKRADVRIAVEQKLKGVRKGRKCVKPKPGRKAGKRCSRFVPRAALTRAGLPSGANRIPFSRKLRPGAYRATIVATDSEGRAGAPARAGFKVVR